MNKIACSVATVVLSLASAGANATVYTILNTSTLNDVRKVGAANIPEISQFSSCIAPSTCSGTVNPLDPAQWPLLDRDITTYTYADPNDPGRAVGIELNNISVNGQITILGLAVTGATINQLGSLGYAAFQNGAPAAPPYVQNNLIAGDPTVINNDPLSGTVVKSVLSNPMVWTYNAGTNQLNHQSGGGTAATSASIATCVPVVAPGVGTGISGQCRQLAAQIDASGELAATTIGNSIWNWDGMGANFIVRDFQNIPWHAATGTSTTGGVQISGPSGHPGVVWDLSGLVDGVGGTVTARVVAAAVGASGTGNAAGMSGLYTLQLQAIVPVPGAVWMLGGALGVLGAIRRRQRAA